MENSLFLSALKDTILLFSGLHTIIDILYTLKQSITDIESYIHISQPLLDRTFLELS